MMPQLPINCKVSICVPVYNAEDYIISTSRTIFEQTLDSLEYIFVDDCSDDNTVVLLQQQAEKYPEIKDRVKIIIHDKNRGPGAARQTGAEVATGQYIYFPDSDDYMEPNMMEIMYDKAKSEDADIIFCKIDLVTPHGNLPKITDWDIVPSDQWPKRMFQSGAPLALWWRLIRTDIVRKSIKDIPFDGLTRFEDFYLSLKCHYYAKVVSVCDKVLYHKILTNYQSLTHQSNATARESAWKVGGMIERFFEQERVLDEYVGEINSFKYRSIYSYAFNSKFFNPKEWRENVKKIDLNHVNYRGGVCSYKIYKFQECLLLNRADKLAFLMASIVTLYNYFKRRIALPC